MPVHLKQEIFPKSQIEKIALANVHHLYNRSYFIFPFVIRGYIWKNQNFLLFGLDYYSRSSPLNDFGPFWILISL